MKWKAIGWSVAGIVAIIGIGIGFMFASGTFKKSTANWRGDVKATEQTQANGQYRIANYNHFFDMCASIQADEERIKNLEEAATDSVKDQTTLTAVKNSRAEKITRYNADAAKEATMGQFRDSGLPYEIRQEGETECHV